MSTKEGFKIEGREKYTSRIKLFLFRHGEKEEDKTKSDFEIGLTDRGRGQAIGKSDGGTNMRQSVAWGSPRKRTQETAGFVMAGKNKEIKDLKSLGELEKTLNREFHFGASKMGIDERLDFPFPQNQAYRNEVQKSLRDGKFLKFLVEKSDKLAEKLKDKESFTYSRGTSKIAKIIQKYLKISPKWDKLVREEEKEYPDSLKRFLGTHQGVGEVFLAKVIEETKGIEERNKFVKALNNQGFDYLEGFDVEILSRKNKKPVIRINYKKEKGGKTIFEFNKGIDEKFLEELIV